LFLKRPSPAMRLPGTPDLLTGTAPLRLLDLLPPCAGGAELVSAGGGGGRLRSRELATPSWKRGDLLSFRRSAPDLTLLSPNIKLACLLA